MRPSQLMQLIKTRFKAGIKRPVHVESPPGVGKTQIAGQAAQELSEELNEDIGFQHLHAPLMQPEDYGFPVISANKDDVRFIVSKDKFPVEGSKHPKRGILLIDELPQADNSGQKIFANLLQEREIHGQKLLDGWMIISTGNRVVDRAGAGRLLSHLRNKITTVELEPSLDDWTNWAFAHGIKTEVINFIRFRPDLLSLFDPNADCNPTPRAWCQGVSDNLGVIPPELELATFSGDVGKGPAAEFIGFLKIYRTLPSIDSILLNPAKAEIPKEPATRFALCGALSNRASGDNFDRIMLYAERMQPEFTTLFIKDAIRRHPDIQNTDGFIKWASGPGAKLLT
jgi:hypothetical protein